jgi:hypothetical protein
LEYAQDNANILDKIACITSVDIYCSGGRVLTKVAKDVSHVNFVFPLQFNWNQFGTQNSF